MYSLCAFAQDGRATVNQDTRLDNRIIDLRVRNMQWCRLGCRCLFFIFLIHEAIKVMDLMELYCWLEEK